MATNIDDIAKIAGVSSTTVSRVINNSGYVKLETRERVLKVISDMHYIPSAVARSLSKRETNTIGIIVPDITNTYFGEIIKGISSIAEHNNLNIVLFNTNNDMVKELKSLKVAKEQRLKGIIMTPSFGATENSEEFMAVINESDIPIVLVSADLKYANLNGIFVDDFNGGLEATNLLLDEGHKQIAIITGLLTSEPACHRVSGYKQALSSRKIPINEEYIFDGQFDLTTAYEITKKIIELEDKPTAMVICSNMMTLGVVKALIEAKMEIPKDMAVVGFNKLEVLDIVAIKLTYVEDSPQDLGEKAMNILLDIFKEKKSNICKRIVMPPKLIVLGSEKYFERPS